MTMKTMLASLVLLTTPAFADHNPEHEQSFDVVLGNGVLICDLEESVTATLESNVPMPDCGVFRTRTGAPVTVTLMGLYEANGVEYRLARFDFHNPVPWGNQTQYGWWGGDVPGEATL